MIQIVPALVGVVDRARLILGHRIDGEVAAGEVGGLPSPQGQMLNATVTAVTSGGTFTGKFAQVLGTPDLNGDGLARADLVIEAVYESMEVKKDVFGRLDKIGFNHICFAVSDIDGLARRLREANVTLLSDPVKVRTMIRPKRICPTKSIRANTKYGLATACEANFRCGFAIVIYQPSLFGGHWLVLIFEVHLRNSAMSSTSWSLK